jgi:hypothetical protein
MNANDLADRLEQFYLGTHIQKASEVLRQQHDEIELLLKFIKERGETEQLIVWKAQKK